MSKLWPKHGIVFLHIFIIYLGLDLRFLDASIEKKPKITVKLKNMKVLRDQQAIFICASVGNPVPKMKWLVNENHNLPKRYHVFNISPQKTILRLEPVSIIDDRSRITCHASSPMGSSLSDATLTIYKKKEEIPAGFPSIHNRPSVVVSEKNTKVILECQVIGNPKPDILWLKDSIPIDLENPRIKIFTSGNLEINKALEEDEGGYECMLTNQYGTMVSPMIRLMIRENIEETYQLIMKNVSDFAPHFVSVSKDQVVTPGSSLTLKCRALGNPIPIVFWKCGQMILQPHSSNSTFQKSEAIVILSDLSESLKCTCIAKNSKESISRTILVTIQEPHTTPILIKVVQVTATSCVVSWNQKQVREQTNYQIVASTISDLQNGKNNKLSFFGNLKKTNSEMVVNKKIENLMPFTNYTVWLEPYPTQSDSIKSNLVSFITLEAAPGSAPRNIELSAISNGALIVIWDPPEIPNGIITGYSIYYTQYKRIPLSRWEKYTVKVISNPESKQQKILSHLLNNFTYYISINAENAAGNGPVSEPQEILVRAGVVQGPKNFKAIAKSSTEIQLFWEPLISKAHISVLFYVLVYMPKGLGNEKMERRWKYTSTQNSFAVYNLKPNTTYEFHLFAETASARGMRSSAECTTSIKAFEEPINVIAQVINSTAISVLWKTSTEMKKQLEVYRLKWRQISSDGLTSSKSLFNDTYLKNNSNLIKNVNGMNQYTISELTPNTQYQIYLNTITRHRVGTTFKSEIVKTWPKKLVKPKLLHLRLSCTINHPCVKMDWKSGTENQKSIKGYRIKYYPLIENADVKYRVIEKNVTDNHFQTSSFDHYQGFQYEFKVAAFNEYEIGEENSGQIFILEGTPSAFPPSFRLERNLQTIPTSVAFSWEKLPQQNLNGRFDHYEVSCFVVNQENKTKSFHSTNMETIVINNLIENTNYACQVRVWIQKAAGMWSHPIFFKTKTTHLPPPEAIRFIRLSHSIAHITWRWKTDFLIYYSHFIIYYNNEKTILSPSSWLNESTKFAFSKFILKTLNPTISYVIRMSAVSTRGIEGPLSNMVNEISLPSQSWPAKYVNQFSCAPDSSTTIQLRWAVEFDIQDLTHFRINFTGITKYVSLYQNYSKFHKEQEQSALMFDQNKYYTHQINNLNPNTIYSINIEPIFGPESIQIGSLNQTLCTTFKEIPYNIEAPILSEIDKLTNQIEIILPQPNMENGTIDVYYIISKILKEKPKRLHRKRSVNKITLDDLRRDNPHMTDLTSDAYIVFSIKNEDAFPPTMSSNIIRKIKMGSVLNDDKIFQPELYYKFQILACIKVRDFQGFKNRCQASPWTTYINIKETVLHKTNNISKDTKHKHLFKGPSTFTTTTIVIILGIVILGVLSMSIALFIKRQQLLKSKLGSVYESHANRMNKEKSMCMEHLLKEPLVDSSVRISTSGSFRLKTQGNNYLEGNPIQLSSTPDLLVRSTVPQILSSLVQFHGQNFNNRHLEYAPIPVEALAEHVALLKENDGKLFNKEYESIEPGQQFTWNSSNMEFNRPKNRYANVITYDHSRVILQPLLSQNSNETVILPGSDYINANYISGYLNPKAYIATQGPLVETIGDFWRMMWEQNSSVIVMMTRLEERDRTKCDQYWPLGGKGSIATYSYINVTIVDIIELAYYTIRKFLIQKLNDNNFREVYQLQFTAWPDHGVPNHPAPLLMFLRRVHSEIPVNCGPIVVHCSAGVGRTGAFIVIDYMLERLRYESTVDVYNYVTNIRAQRNYMVQTEDQYIFIYETLLEAVQCGNTEVPVAELANHIEKLNQIEINHKTVDGIQMTGLQMEFENLVLSSEGFLQVAKLNSNNYSHCSTPSTIHGNIVTNYQPLTYETATQLVNQMKNRIIQILPPDFSRVSICPIRGVEGSDYINASWIDGYRSRKAYIAAQSPLSETCEDFWRTLWEYNSSIIVMLTLLKENNRERCYQYWPHKRSSRFQFFIVDPVAEYNMTTYIIREFKLTDTRDSQSRVIRQFQFTDWQESESIPHSTQVFLDLINQVHKTKVQLGHVGPITVHCSAGTGRTGIFLALSNIIERMKNESVIDLFQTVKLLRWQRPALLQTEDQYQFCYMAALEYLKIFEHMLFDV